MSATHGLGWTAARFWSRTRLDAATGCAIWTGPPRSNGYGQVSYLGRNFKAHRFAWMLSGGTPADGVVICHRCDTPLCVNPQHLFAGSQRDNLDDMRAKGRAVFVHGEKVGSARLTESLVHGIRKRIASGESDSAIARSVGVCSRTIRDIRCGITWARVQSAAA